MKIIPYIRVSSDEQTKGNGIPEQIANVENYCARNGFELVKPLIDDGYSASKGDHLSRGKLGTLLEHCEKGKYKGYGVAVSEMDRLSRQGIGETRELLTRFTKAGVEIHITQTNRVIRSTEDVVTELLNVLESHGAAEYSRKLSERIGKAWAAKKRNAGTKVLTRNVPFWLRVVHGKIVTIPERVKIVREMFRLAAMGLGRTRIANKINAGLSIGTIIKTLGNRSVLGEFQPHRYVNGKRVPDGDPVTDYFPAIIKASEWSAARAEVERRTRTKDQKRRFCTKNANAENLFTGLLYDASSLPVRTVFFQAKHKSTSYSKAWLVSAYDRDTHRKSNRFLYAKFEKAFLGYLKDLDWRSIAAKGKSDEETQLEKQLDAKLTELGRVERRIAKTKAAMDAEDVEPGELRILARKLDQDETALMALTSEKDTLQASLEAAKATSAALQEPDELKALIGAILKSDNVELRLRARTEIRKRVRGIGFRFRDGVLHRVEVWFINGVLDLGVIVMRKDEALLIRFDKQPRRVKELFDSSTTVSL